MENLTINKAPEFKGMAFAPPTQVTRYVITDALGNIAGKPKGYKSMRTALSVANNHHNGVYAQLQSALERTCPTSNYRTIFRVQACQFNISEL